MIELVGLNGELLVAGPANTGGCPVRRGSSWRRPCNGRRGSASVSRVVVGAGVEGRWLARSRSTASELAEVCVADDLAELLLGLEHAGGGPAQAHVAVAGLPAFDVAADELDHRLDRVGALQRLLETALDVQAGERERLLEALAQRRGRGRMRSVEFVGEGRRPSSASSWSLVAHALSIRVLTAGALALGQVGGPHELTQVG